MKTRFALAVLLAPLLAACVTVTPASEDADIGLERMLSGQSAMQGARLAAEIEKAAAFPLGSEDNPVRTQGPAGQRAYLGRLRCADGNRPEFARIGSAGFSRYENIMDAYRVECVASTPEERTIYLDMYHAGHVESRAVEGYLMLEP